MGPSKKNAKATRKFENKHLKGVLERRKVVAKIKQKVEIKAKKQVKRTRDDDFLKGPDGGAKDGKAAASDRKIHQGKGAAAAGKAAEMSVDDFFQAGFEILDKQQSAEKENKASSTTEGKKTPAKRKRDQLEDDAGGSDDGSDGDSDSDAGVPDDRDLSDGQEDDEGVGMSKDAMKSLKDRDPEFYAFLKENDPEALDFDPDADFAEIDDLSGASDGEENRDEDSDEDGDKDGEPKKKRQKRERKEKGSKKGKKGAGANNEADDRELTLETVAQWRKAMSETHSLRAARSAVIAFRCATLINEDAEDGKQQRRYTISSPEVFHHVLMAALKQIPEVMQHHIPVKESASGRIHVSTEGKKFKTLSLMLKSFAGSIVHLLGTLSDEGSLKLTLSALEPLLPYLLSFRKLLKVIIKTVVAFWSQSASTDATRITAFLVLRRLMVVGDQGVMEAVLRAIYQGLLQGCRLTNANTIQGINLMKNMAAELWGVDQNFGYTTAFTFIRQAAMHLRDCIANNKNDAFKKVYNWQYVHSLDFWSCVLAEHCSSLKEAEAGRPSPLRPLIYPLVQVTLGAMGLIPTAMYFPLRFHMVRALLRLSRATDTYIPLAPALLEVLASAEMRRAPLASPLMPFDFAIAYKAPKSYLRTRPYQDGVGAQVSELLGEHLVLWARSIAFPELALPITIAIKRWLKQARRTGKGHRAGGIHNTKVTTQLMVLVQKVEANARFVEEKRARVEFAPKNRTQVDAFLRDLEWDKMPLGAFVAGQRKVRAERERVEQEARREGEKKRREGEGKGRVSGKDKEDGDEGEEEEEEEEEEASGGEDDHGMGEDMEEDGDVDMEEVGEWDDEDEDDE